MDGRRMLSYIICQIWIKNKFLQKLNKGEIIGEKDELSSESCLSDFSFA